MANRPRRARTKSKIIWPDKLALFIALVIFGLAAVFWVDAVITTGDANLTFLGESLARCLRYTLLIAAPVWILLRAIDFMTGGPARRKAREAEKPQEPKQKPS